MSSRSVVLVIAAVSALALVLWLATGQGARDARSSRNARPRVSEPPALVEHSSSAIAEVAAAPPAEEVSAPQDPEAVELPASPTESKRVQAQEAELAEARWVEGRVIFPPDTPADESVRVVARGRKLASGREHRCEVGPDGAFRVAFAEKTRKGRISLEARYLYLEDGPLLVDLDELPSPLVLEPELGGWIEGRIVVPPDSGVTQESLAGASVHLIDFDSYRRTMGQEPSAVLDGQGFSLTGLRPSSRYSLELESEIAFAPRILGLEVWGGKRTEAELVAGLAVSVSGRVVDEHGAPLGEILVTAFSASRRGRFPIVTGADGGFHIRGLAPGLISLEAQGEGLAEAQHALEATEPGMVLEGIELVLASGVSIRGRVQWPDGRPAENARIEIWSESSDPPWSGHSRADESGAFSAGGLTADSYRIEAHAEFTTQDEAGDRSEKARSTWSARVEGVAAGTEDIVLTLEPGLSVFGTVRDDLGELVDSFRIEAQLEDSRRNTMESFRDTHGAFELSDLTLGTWTIQARAGGHGSSQPVRVEVSGMTPSVELIVPRAGRVEGLVVDESGRPVARTRVSLVCEEHAFSLWGLTDGDLEHTDESGRFVFENVPPGSVSLLAIPEFAAPSQPMAMTLEPGGSISGIELRLGRAEGRIGGLVVDASGRGLASREVTLLGRAPIMPRQTRSDDHGAFAFENLPAGDFRLYSPATPEERTLLPDDEPAWRYEDLLGREARVKLADGESKEVRLAPPILDPVRMHGRVLAAGTPLAGAFVWFHSIDERRDTTNTETADDGSYSAILSQPGGYSVQVHDQNRGWWVGRRVEVPDVESFALDVTIVTGSLSGRVHGPDGTPLAHIPVNAQSSDSEEGDSGGCQTITGADGAYALVLPPGTYVISAGTATFWDGSPASQSWCSANAEVEVRAEQEKSGIDFELRRGGTIEGAVRTASGSALGIGAHVFVVDAAGNLIATAPVLPTGSYRITGIPPGTVLVEARSEGWATPARLELEVEADGKTRADLELVPSSGEPREDG